MMPTLVNEATSVPPPAYHRAQARLGPALHIDALALVNTLHLLTLCRLAVRLAHHRCPPPLPSGPGGAPRTYSEESLLLIALLRTLWRLSRSGMCATGYVTGPLLHWHAACHWARMAIPAFLHLLSSASVDIKPKRRFQRPSSF
jgi:hypothetical protein